MKCRISGIVLFLLFTLFFSMSLHPLTVGVEGTADKRENGDTAFLPGIYIEASGSRFIDESLSFFADFSGRSAYDSAAEIFPYDAVLSGSMSYRRESFFAALGLSSRVIEDYETSREWRNLLEGTVSFPAGDFEFFLKPFTAGILGDTDSVSFGAEPGLTLLLFSSLVSTLSLRGEFTLFKDSRREYSLEPRLVFDWYPSVPVNAGVKAGWIRTADVSGEVLSDEVSGEVDLLWYPLSGLVLTLSLPVTREFYHVEGTEVWRIKPRARLRRTLPEALGGADLLIQAGFRINRYTDDDVTETAWLVRVGVEKSF
jgi:hypothetical protein